MPSQFGSKRLLAELKAVVLEETAIADRVGQLGREISGDYGGQSLVVVGILTGAFVFACDLLRALKIDAVADFMSVSRYSRRPGTGEVKILKDLQLDVAGRHLLIIEDIVDTGLTLNYLVRNLANRQPASLAICTLLDRVELRLADVPIRYTGFTVSSEFLVGYGLDFQEKYRNLPYIATMKRPDEARAAQTAGESSAGAGSQSGQPAE